MFTGCQGAGMEQQIFGGEYSSFTKCPTSLYVKTFFEEGKMTELFN